MRTDPNRECNTAAAPATVSGARPHLSLIPPGVGKAGEQALTGHIASQETYHALNGTPPSGVTGIED